MHKRLWLFGVASIVAAWSLASCGPKYPECRTDEDCAEHGEYCVGGTCKQCRDDSHCNANNPCRICGANYTCEAMPNCCTSDLDCPGGKCWPSSVQGANFGECGPKCRSDADCPADQACKDGNCVPKAECQTDADCGPGKRCVDGKCVIAECEMKPIYFDFDDSTIRRDQKPVLEANAECMRQQPNRGVTIEGHCDERGTEEYNLALGERRARAARRYLEKLGVTNSLQTISYGEERPVCYEHNEDCWWRNRRAEFKWSQ